MTEVELEEVAKQVAARLFVMDEKTLARTIDLFNTGAAMELRPERLKITTASVASTLPEPNHECSDQGPGKVTY